MKTPLLRLLPVLAAAAVLVVCAPESGGGKGVPLELYMSAAFGSKLASLQASVVSQKGFVPEDRRCIADQVSLDKFVLQEDAAGKLKHAVIFPQTLTSGGQDLKLKGVTAGKDYTIVIEALSADDPPAVLGSTNFAVAEFQPEENRTENVTLKPFAQVDGGNVLPDGGSVTGACDRDPRIDK